MSDASQTKLSFRDEVAWGEDPAAPSPQVALREFRFTSETLNFNQETANSEEIRDDRNISNIIRVAAESSGDVNIETSFGSHDPLLEGAFFNNWSTAVDVNDPNVSPLATDAITITANVTSPVSASTGTMTNAGSPDGLLNLQVGAFFQISNSQSSPTNDGFYRVVSNAAGTVTFTPSTPASETNSLVRIRSSFISNGTVFKSFLIEKEFRDVAQFFAFTGMRVGAWAQNIAPGSILNGSLSFQGEIVVDAAASVSNTSPAVLPTNTTEVFNAVDHVSNVKINDAAQVGVNFTEIAFSVDNQLRPQPAIGSLANVEIGSGQVLASGTFTSYFQNKTLYDQFRQFTNVSLSFVVSIGGNSYVYHFPSFKLTTGEVVAGGNNQDVLAQFGFTAQRDATLGYTIGLSRIASNSSILLPATASQ